jgi:hypothetical protein
MCTASAQNEGTLFEWSYRGTIWRFVLYFVKSMVGTSEDIISSGKEVIPQSKFFQFSWTVSGPEL